MNKRIGILDVIESKDFLILDTETTGLNDRAEIVSIAVIRSDGTTLLNSLVKPVRPIPPDATRIHGITNEMVASAPPFPTENIFGLLRGRNVIVYNAQYDKSMLYRSAAAVERYDVDWTYLADWFCAMEAFSEIYGEWNDYHGNYKWQKLSTACTYYKIPVVGAHGALADCQMTLKVCEAMLKASQKTPTESEFALIGCSECGATGQPLTGGLCPQCFAHAD